LLGDRWSCGAAQWAFIPGINVLASYQTMLSIDDLPMPISTEALRDLAAALHLLTEVGVYRFAGELAPGLG
jgi:hypothetical protein